ncbi:hypothetical protein MY10362_006870 [Beauveria mimosiformis]
MIPGIVALQEKINPIVVKGDMWRLNLPDDSDWPATLFVFRERHAGGLDPQASYRVDGNMTLSGSTLMRLGLQYTF